MTSSSWHGVTTTLIGNCGMSFAPVDRGSEAYLAEMMESVEDIPRDAILDGIPWDWTTHPQYLDSVQRLNPALNVVGLVGHCAVRYQVMGERSLEEGEQPTVAELDRMRDIVAESIAGGAVGYSTSRILVHTVPDGRKVPGTYATNDEHLALADGMNDAGGGVFQAVLDFETRAGNEFQLLRAMAERAGDVLFTVGPGNDEAVGLGAVDLWDGLPHRHPGRSRPGDGLHDVPAHREPDGPGPGAAGQGRALARGHDPPHPRRAPGRAAGRRHPGCAGRGRSTEGPHLRPPPHPPPRPGRPPRVRRRRWGVGRRPGRSRRRRPDRAGHRPPAGERRPGAVQPVVLPPQPGRHRAPAGPRRRLPGRRRRRGPRRPDLRLGRGHPLPGLLVPGPRPARRCPRRSTG